MRELLPGVLGSHGANPSTMIVKKGKEGYEFPYQGARVASVWLVDEAAPSALLGGGLPGKQKHVNKSALTGGLSHEQRGRHWAGHEDDP